MWIRNKDSKACYEVFDEKILDKLRRDERFEVDIQVSVVEKEVKRPIVSEGIQVSTEHTEPIVIVEKTETDIEEERDNFCSICGREFKNASGLSAHNRAKHGGE